MSRLLVHVEGETEETFVNEALRPHLYGFGFTQVSARIVGNARLRERRGGIRGWDSVRKDILRHLKGDADSFSTTMVDYYGLPQSGQGAWPGRLAAGVQPHFLKAQIVEQAISADLIAELGGSFDKRRFVPFVIMHEFEGLLFSDCATFGKAIGQPHLASRFQAIRDQFSNPEEINDSPVTAPSKRVELLMPSYEKPFLGNLAILEIGLEKIRLECPHFREWLNVLQNLPCIQK